MRNVIVLWSKTSSDRFEKSIPLYFLCKRSSKLGFNSDIDVLFLEGYQLLDKEYIESLKDLGYKLYDVQRIYSILERRYSALDRFGDFEKKCFLRWLAIKEFYSGEEIIHYDGDIVFNEDPKILEQKFTGKTFVLQGCPALTAIYDTAWYTEYAKNLDLFTADIEGYSIDAWEMRDKWEVSLKTKWSGSRERKVISSDQDLLSHLIHTDQIVQENPLKILSDASEYIFFENPLLIHDTNKDFPYKYKRVKGVDFINKKRIGLWHMQSEWNFYLVKFIFRKRYLKFLSYSTLKYKKWDFEDYLNRMFRKISNGETSCRHSVYKYFFQDNDFSEIFTNKVWWKKGIFS